MAVIKIVPMPGAEGQKGDTGAAGPQGPQGATGAQGPAGADAVWYYNGAYNPGASYAVGDVVTYQGQTWYRKHANGGNVGDTPSVGPFWDLIAAKGSDITTSSISSSGTWDTKFAELNGIDIGTDVNSSAYIYYQDHKMGMYYCIGDLVYFDFRMILSKPVSWGTSNAWAFQLPFTPYYDLPVATSSNGALRNQLNRQVANGWFRVQADADPTPNFGLLSEENNYSENEVHYLIANCIIRAYPLDTETGLYTSIGLPNAATVWPAENPKVGVAFIVAQNQEPETVEPIIGYPGNPRTIGYRSVGSTWPANLVEALADQNDETPANNAGEVLGPLGVNSNVVQFNFSGVYRRA